MSTSAFVNSLRPSMIEGGITGASIDCSDIKGTCFKSHNGIRQKISRQVQQPLPEKMALLPARRRQMERYQSPSSTSSDKDKECLSGGDVDDEDESFVYKRRSKEDVEISDEEKNV